MLNWLKSLFNKKDDLIEEDAVCRICCEEDCHEHNTGPAGLPLDNFHWLATVGEANRVLSLWTHRDSHEQWCYIHSKETNCWNRKSDMITVKMFGKG